MKKILLQKKWIALAIMAAMAMGICACGSSGSSADNAAGAAAADTTAVDTMVTEDIAEYEAGEVASEEDLADYETAEAAAKSDSGADTEEEAGETSTASETDQKLIKTVNMTVETTEYDRLLAAIEQKVEALGGYVESSEMSSADTYSDRWSYMTLRVPADQLDSLVEQVEENANVTYKTENVEDVTLTYVDMESHISALRTEQETLTEMLGEATDLDTIFAIQSQLTTVRYEIESYESQLRVLKNQVSYSTVYLDINEVERESAGDGTSFRAEVKNRLGVNLYRMKRNSRSFAIGFIASLPIIIIWVVVIVVILLICRRIYRKRKKRKEKQYENRRLSYKERGEKEEDKPEDN